jgi:hypothetical protein
MKTKVGSRQEAVGNIVVKRTAGGKFTFKLSSNVCGFLHNLIQAGMPRHAPKTAPMVIHACAWACVAEVFEKINWWNTPVVKEIKITLTYAQACAMIYVMIPYDQPFIIDLKAQLLKAL